MLSNCLAEPNRAGTGPKFRASSFIRLSVSGSGLIIFVQVLIIEPHQAIKKIETGWLRELSLFNARFSSGLGL